MMEHTNPGVALEVANPCGQTDSGRIAAPRLPDLHGKTICELWHGHFRGDDTFPALREMLLRRFPDARVVPYTEFPEIYPVSAALFEKIGVLAKEKGCDAFVVGNGG